MQPGPPIIYPCDVSIMCSAIMSLNKVLQTQPSMQQSKKISWVKEIHIIYITQNHQTQTTTKLQKRHLNIPWYNTVVWQLVFFSSSVLKRPSATVKDTSWMSCWWVRKQATKNRQWAQMCASLSSCQKEEFHSCDWIINTKHGFKKKFSPNKTLCLMLLSRRQLEHRK